jgi:hypothetical protein
VKLRQVEVLQGQGMSIADAVRQIGVTQQTYYLYRSRNLVEGFFNKIKQCRRIATGMTNSRQTTLPSSSWRQSVFGYALASPRPSSAAWRDRV